MSLIHSLRRAVQVEYKLSIQSPQKDNSSIGSDKWTHLVCVPSLEPEICLEQIFLKFIYVFKRPRI